MFLTENFIFCAGTIEYEECKKLLKLLDIAITNNTNKKYQFKIHGKNAITNMHITRNSCTYPNMIKNGLKYFLHCPWDQMGSNWYEIGNKTCYIPKVSKVYVENGYLC